MKKLETTNTSSLDTATTGDQRAAPAAHTPGPWAVDETAVHSESMVTLNIAKCSSAERRPSLREKSQLIGFDECVANARLIAAAPLMLSYHEENARLLGRVIHDLQGRVEGGKLAALSQCLDRSQTAIALAEGR